MPVMDKHTLNLLEFDKILDMVASYAVTEPGKNAVLNTTPLDGMDKIETRIGLVSEFRLLLSEDRHPGIEHFGDLTPLFHRLKPEDPVLDPLKIREFLPLFTSAINLKRLDLGSSCHLLGEILAELNTHPELKAEIENSINPDGKILDGASYELSGIRERIRTVNARIRDGLEEILRKRELKLHLQDFFITERNERWVIPVKSDSKGHIPGVIHDISNTGETLFIEPYEIQALGNELESLRAEEKVEEFRILKRLSLMLRESLTGIERDYETVVKVDTIQALSTFSEIMGATPPEINKDGYLKIIGGRHPLLWKTLRRLHQEDELVPLNFELGRDFRTIVITGSNTGGKTVALKTVGILVIMALSGMHIPAESGTTIPLLRDILADIGDEQSIEQSLSTFSGHITRISEIISKCGSDTLVLIDELGTGTDPDEGGALSCAILRRLKERDALTAVSTHLGLLKAFAYTEPDMINGAMEMEEEDRNGVKFFRPTYRLVIGESGQSYAFEIARRFGIPEEILEDAGKFLKEADIKIEALISELKKRKKELDMRLLETESLKEELMDIKRSTEERLKRAERERKETLTRAIREAEDILRRSRREAREILERLRSSDMEAAKESIKRLDRRLAELGKRRLALTARTSDLRPLRDLKIGQTVLLKNLGIEGVVRSINPRTQRCRVVVAGREIEISREELAEPAVLPGERGRRGRDEGAETPPYKVIHGTAHNAVPHEINLIGRRVDPALSDLERYLNDASLAGLESVRIIHGRGSGRLAAAIRDYLKDHPLVKGYKREPDDAGDAVTTVHL
jgi:DNA mismatch repair protein MutS2